MRIHFGAVLIGLLGCENLPSEPAFEANSPVVETSAPPQAQDDVLSGQGVTTTTLPRGPVGNMSQGPVPSASPSASASASPSPIAALSFAVAVEDSLYRVSTSSDEALIAYRVNHSQAWGQAIGVDANDDGILDSGRRKGWMIDSSTFSELIDSALQIGPLAVGEVLELPLTVTGEHNVILFFKKAGEVVDQAVYLRMQPIDFLGVSSVVSDAEGEVTVSWSKPTIIDDENHQPDIARYNSFHHYRIGYVDANDQFVFLAQCVNCTSDASHHHLTLSSLDPFRTYKFYVEARSAQNEPLNELHPKFHFVAQRVLDETPPSFVPNLQSNLSALNYTLSWSAASDNQYAAEPASISYEVYRRASSSFSSAANPSSDGVLVATISTLSHDMNLGSLDEFETYYHTVCAKDQSGNTNCPGQVLSITVPDRTVPVLSGASALQDGQNWTLSWSVSDNSASNVLVAVYRKTSMSAVDFPTTSGSNVGFAYDLTQVSGQVCDLGSYSYANYLIVAIDETGNQSSLQHSIACQ